MRRWIRTLTRRGVHAVGITVVALSQAMLVTVLALPQGFGPGLRAQSAPSDASSSVPSAPDPKPPEVRMERMEDYYAALGEMRDGLPREDFDPQTVVEKIGKSPGDLRDWVAENIAWVPYRGRLRSPSAVMMDGTGNSLDRAVLLAHLLTLAGHTPRLAMAEVPEAWVEDRLAPLLADGGEVREPVLPQEMEVPDSVRDPSQRDLVNRYIDRRRQTLVDTVGRARDQLPVFVERLRKTDANPPPPVPAPSNHWWVALEDEEGGVRFDPSGTAAMEADQSFAPSELPPEYRQTVTVVVRVRQWKDGGSSWQVALSHSFPAPVIGNGHFQIGFVPEDVSLPFAQFREKPEETMAAFRRDTAAATQWVPFLQHGDDIVTDQGFTATGEVNRDHESSARGAAMKQATGLLGALGGGDEGGAGKGILTGVSVDFVIEGPGGETETLERTIYQLDSEPPGEDLSDREKLERGLAFAGVTDVLAQTSALRRDYLTFRALNHELGNRTAMLGTLHYMNREDAGNLQKSVEKLKAFPEKLYEFAITRLMVNPKQQRVQIGRPNLIGYQRMLRLDEEDGLVLTEGFDLIHTRVDPLPGKGDVRQARLEQAVVDAALESAMARRNDLDTVSASGLLESVPAEEWLWLENQADLDRLAGDLDEGVRRRLLDAMEEGNAVFVPESLASLPPSESAWWEMSAETGTLVGRIATGGWGGTSTEYLINFYVAKAAMTMLAVSAAACADDPGFGCIACNFASAVLIVGGIFAGPPGAVMAVVLGNMVVNLGCVFL